MDNFPRLSFIKNIFKIFYSKGFFNSLPWLFLIIGGGLAYLGTFKELQNPKLNDFVLAIGKSILAGGVISLLLKSMQFMGIIKDELSKIVSDPDYLQNRNDLPEYWGRVTRVLFENKFPLINLDITEDIKETYLPTKLPHYYEGCCEVINIDIIDESKSVINVVQKTSFNLVPGGSHKEFKHPYFNRLKKGENFTSTFSLDYVKINGEDATSSVNFDQKDLGTLLESTFTIEVKGVKKYEIEYQVSKQYSLLDDDVLRYVNSFIHHNYRVQIFLEGVKVNFFEVGTISKFKNTYETDKYLEMQFSGLLYKGQGFIIFIKKY